MSPRFGVLPLLFVVLAGFGLTGCRGNYIYEYPHTRVSIHAHPHSGERLDLEKIRSALAKRVHEQELDLYYRRSDGQIVADHDNAFPEPNPDVDHRRNPRPSRSRINGPERWSSIHAGAC